MGWRSSGLGESDCDRAKFRKTSLRAQLRLSHDGQVKGKPARDRSLRETSEAGYIPRKLHRGTGQSQLSASHRFSELKATRHFPPAVPPRARSHQRHVSAQFTVDRVVPVLLVAVDPEGIPKAWLGVASIVEGPRHDGVVAHSFDTPRKSPA